MFIKKIYFAEGGLIKEGVGERGMRGEEMRKRAGRVERAEDEAGGVGEDPLIAAEGHRRIDAGGRIWEGRNDEESILVERLAEVERRGFPEGACEDEDDALSAAEEEVEDFAFEGALEGAHDDAVFAAHLGGPIE